MSWTREFTASFPKIARKWLFTVCEDSASMFVADRFVWPSKMSRATRCSVRVRESQPVSGFDFLTPIAPGARPCPQAHADALHAAGRSAGMEAVPSTVQRRNARVAPAVSELGAVSRNRRHRMNW